MHGNEEKMNLKKEQDWSFAMIIRMTTWLVEVKPDHNSKSEVKMYMKYMRSWDIQTRMKQGTIAQNLKLDWWKYIFECESS